MAIKMVREPSDTPNINNIDDIVPMRYAYGGQNGYVIGKGTEISNTVNGLNFTVNSGRLVLQGVECDIDATGVTITIDNIATKRYYTVYLEVNLGLNTATIKDEYDTATYPTIDAGDDLTENTTGVARLPLYQFTATSGVIGEINKVVESVKYINNDFIENVKVNNAINADNATNSINATNAIVNSDGTYSGLTKNSNGIIQDGQNLLMTLKPIYTNSNGLSIENNASLSISLGVEHQLDPNKIYFIVAEFISSPTSECNSLTGFSKPYLIPNSQIRTLIMNNYVKIETGGTGVPDTITQASIIFRNINGNTLRVSSSYTSEFENPNVKLYGLYELLI